MNTISNKLLQAALSCRQPAQIFRYSFRTETVQSIAALHPATRPPNKYTLYTLFHYTLLLLAISGFPIPQSFCIKPPGARQNSAKRIVEVSQRFSHASTHPNSTHPSWSKTTLRFVSPRLLQTPRLFRFSTFAMKLLFVAPATPTTSASAPFRHPSSPRRPANTPHPIMSASNNPSHSSQPDPYPGENDLSFARFREFHSSAGDSAVQNDLVREVMWQATRTLTTQNMESTIQEEIDAVSHLLSEMYTRSERDIVQRNEQLALQTCLPNISKWNQQLIAGHKESKLRKSQISKELELVDAMLRRSRRKRKSNNPSHSKPHTKSFQPNPDNLPSRITLLRNVLQIKQPKPILFTIAVCVFALESFENITTHENGPSQLANYAAIASIFLLSCAYLHTLHSAYTQANRDLQRTGTFVNHKDKTN